MGRNIRELPPTHNGRATILAIDFDGTLCVHKFPEIGEPFLDVINDLIEFRKQGGKLILWTCRDGNDLFKAIKWANDFGLWFDAINEDTEWVRNNYGRIKSCKVCADFYIDDRNL